MNNIMKSIYEIVVTNSNNSNVPLTNYKNKIILIVNVASKCGFTKQYADLQKLYERYKDQGLEILAFPCNQFLQQEPGSNQEIVATITKLYGVTFPIFAKIDVRGANQAEIYHWIATNYQSNSLLPLIPWNFTKFLISRNGIISKRFIPTCSFKTIEQHIAKEI
jgi:glutathione peroxidase